MKREGRLLLRTDLRCPKSRCDGAIVEYRYDEPLSTYTCKKHGDVVPLVKGLSGSACRNLKNDVQLKTD